MKISNNTFYCFSPPVMLATFILEWLLFLYTVWRYRLSAITRVISSTLILLALFQLAEFNVCEGWSTSAPTWSRIGYVAITMLPPLGVHLMLLIAKKKRTLLKTLAYGTGLLWSGLFGLSAQAFAGHACGGNYVIFTLKDPLSLFYGIYYWGWLILTIYLAWKWSMEAKKPIKSALRLLVVGYLLFMVPTTVISTLNPVTRAAIPSIMCGFAVLFALILVFGIAPKVAKTHKR